MTLDKAQEEYDNQLPEEDNEDDMDECCRCETKELIENMMETSMGYLCECCEGDLF